MEKAGWRSLRQAPAGSRRQLLRMGVAALLAMVGVGAVVLTSGGGPGLSGGSASAVLGRDIAGVWEGTGVLEIPVPDRPPYRAGYSVRITVDDRRGITAASWTHGEFLLERVTLDWRSPRDFDLRMLKRQDFDREAFSDVPPGEFTILERRGDTLLVDYRHPRSLEVQALECELLIPEGEASMPANGRFVSSHEARHIATRAVGSSDLAGKPVAAAIEALLPPAGTIPCPATLITRFAVAPRVAFPAAASGLGSDFPMNGKESLQPASLDALTSLHDVPLPGWPGRMVVSCPAAQARAEFGEEPTAVVELDSSAMLIFEQGRPRTYRLEVAFLPDGQAVALIPDRELRIPLHRRDEGLLAQDHD